MHRFSTFLILFYPMRRAVALATLCALQQKPLNCHPWLRHVVKPWRWALFNALIIKLSKDLTHDTPQLLSSISSGLFLKSIQVSITWWIDVFYTLIMTISNICSSSFRSWSACSWLPNMTVSIACYIYRTRRFMQGGLAALLPIFTVILKVALYMQWLSFRSL